MKKLKVLVLYSELAGYVLASLEKASAHFDILVVHWPVNAEAPFQFEFPDGVQFMEKTEDDSWKHTADAFEPQLIICSGWIDKSYLKQVRKHKKAGARVVLTLDNQWDGRAKQKLASLIARFTFKSLFDYAWVAGKKQEEYALRLGFEAGHIRTGFYVADMGIFEQIYLERKDSAREPAFVYVGRYVEEKGIQELWLAFEEYRKKGGYWELICIGTGALWENRPEMEGLRHIGFKQPKDLPEYLKKASAFILPSKFEPWGVVVQEVAAAGLPMVLSRNIGARHHFLEEGVNGYSLEAGNVDQLVKHMFSLEKKTTEELEAMGNRSHELAQQMTHQTWIDSLQYFISLGSDE